MELTVEEFNSFVSCIRVGLLEQSAEEVDEGRT